MRLQKNNTAIMLKSIVIWGRGKVIGLTDKGLNRAPVQRKKGVCMNRTGIISKQAKKCKALRIRAEPFHTNKAASLLVKRSFSFTLLPFLFCNHPIMQFYLSSFSVSLVILSLLGAQVSNGGRQGTVLLSVGLCIK